MQRDKCIRQLITFCSVTNLQFIFPVWFVLLERDADVFLLRLEHISQLLCLSCPQLSGLIKASLQTLTQVLCMLAKSWHGHLEPHLQAGGAALDLRIGCQVVQNVYICVYIHIHFKLLGFE